MLCFGSLAGTVQSAGHVHFHSLEPHLRCIGMIKSVLIVDFSAWQVLRRVVRPQRPGRRASPCPARGHRPRRRSAAWSSETALRDVALRSLTRPAQSPRSAERDGPGSSCGLERATTGCRGTRWSWCVSLPPQTPR